MRLASNEREIVCRPLSYINQEKVTHPMSNEQLLALAKLGAVARLSTLQAEIDALYATFPELRPTGKDSPAATKTSRAAASKPSAEQAPPVAKKTRGDSKQSWNAAARQAVSERMKKYWAGRRAKAAKAAKADQAKPVKSTKAAKPVEPTRRSKTSKPAETPKATN